MLQVHLARHGVKGLDKFKCDLCDKVLSDEHNLKRHKLRHSDERPYGCSQCKLRFKVNMQSKEKRPLLHYNVLCAFRS